ncbi:hypothetical protein Bca52824_066097 [Brassica carinata]|uniref:Uncharacterized protein n=1 Tax=Brassica carinata TaxID=52824 RepID=A0A8X7QLB5_BRACI|nr:hypothetical protein Bca52824_066097 [Brassica carinata]
MVWASPTFLESSTSDMVEEIFLTAKAKVMNNVALENKIIKAPKVGDLEPNLVVSYKLHIAVPFLHFPAMNDWVYHNDNSQLPLSQLKAGRSRTTVVRRLLYFWEARDVKKVIELMEIDIVLSDPGI